MIIMMCLSRAFFEGNEESSHLFFLPTKLGRVGGKRGTYLQTQLLEQSMFITLET